METRFGRRTVLLLLVVLVLISIGLRYPLVEHERFQTDSYHIHYLAKSISDDGQAGWTLSPLSYFGYYPLSYPSGTPFVIADVSILTGTSIEFSILLVNMFFGVLLCLGVFIMARSFLVRDQFVILATLFAIFAPRFVDTTYWDGSARGPLVVLFVLAAFCYFRAGQMGQQRLQVLGLLLAFGCFVTHHMAVLLVLYGISYLMVWVQVNYLLPRVRFHRRAWTAMFNSVLGLSILLVASLLYDFWGELVIAGSGEDALFSSGPEALVVLLNVGVSYTHQIGLVLFVAILGVPMLLKDSSLTSRSLFPLALVLAFLPLFSRSIYVSMLLTPFVAVIGVYWIARQASRPSRKRAVAVIVGLLVLGSAVVSFWSVERWNGTTYVGGYTVEVGSDIFADAAYLDTDYAGRDAIANSKIVGTEFAALSDAVFLGSGVQLLIDGEVTLDDIRANSRRSRADFPTNLYSWFEYAGEPKADYYILMMMIHGPSYVASQSNLGTAAGEYFSRHAKLVIAVDNDLPESYVTDYNVQDSVMASELKESSWEPSPSGGTGTTNAFSSYLIYCSEQTSYYIVELPV